MLTQNQRDIFRKALASWNCSSATAEEIDIDDMLDDSDIVETRDTLDDFFSHNGRRLKRDGSQPTVPFERSETLFGYVYCWTDVQAAKGKRRGDLYVMDFGDARAAYFTGEV